MVGRRNIPSQWRYQDKSSIRFFEVTRVGISDSPTLVDVIWLVVWKCLEHGFYCPFHIWDVIPPIDELIYFSRWVKPPTSNSLAGRVNAHVMLATLGKICDDQDMYELDIAFLSHFRRFPKIGVAPVIIQIS